MNEEVRWKISGFAGNSSRCVCVCVCAFVSMLLLLTSHVYAQHSFITFLCLLILPPTFPLACLTSSPCSYPSSSSVSEKSGSFSNHCKNHASSNHTYKVQMHTPTCITTHTHTHKSAQIMYMDYMLIWNNEPPVMFAADMTFSTAHLSTTLSQTHRCENTH